MHAWEAIQKVVDYIEDNLEEEHSPEKLSDIAALSPFYFQRLFTRLVRRPVNEYVKMRRLARACEVLADKNKRIMDIALAYGFKSHESFTRTFKNAFGITPETYRNHPVRLNQITKPELVLGYTMIDENVPLITDRIVLEISRRVIENPELYIGLLAPVSISSQLPVGETTGIDVPGQLWDSFHAQKARIKELVPGGTELAASTMNGTEEGSFDYFAGALAASGTAAYDDFVTWELPSGEYIVCSFEAENFEELVTSALDKCMNYLFRTWLPEHKLSTQPFSAEKYIDVTPELCRMELWVMPLPVAEPESR